MMQDSNGMRHVLSHVTRCALVLVLAFGMQGFAQDDAQVDVLVQLEIPDERLENYNNARKLLRSSLEVFTDDSAEATRNIESAEILFQELQAGGIGENSLVEGVSTTFDNAISAIDIRSLDDLAVQTAAIEGGLQRLLYESAIKSLNDGDFDIAKQRILQIAQDMGAEETRQQVLKDAVNRDALLSALDVVVADNITSFSNESEGFANEQNINDAYRSLANAYSDYVVVQDSSRMPAQTRSTFRRAIESLLDVNNQQGANFSDEIQNLNQQMGAFKDSAASTISGVTQAVDLSGSQPVVPTSSPSLQANTPVVVADAPSLNPPVVGVPEVVSVPSVDTNNASVSPPNLALNVPQSVNIPQGASLPSGLTNSVDGAVGVVGDIANQAQNGVQAVGTTVTDISQQSGNIVQPLVQRGAQVPQLGVAGSDNAGNTGTALQVPTTPSGDSAIAVANSNIDQLTVAESRQVFAAQLRESSRRDLADFNLPASTIDDLVNTYASGDVASVDGVFNQIYANIARSTSAVELGNNVLAQEEILQASDTYGRYLQPIIAELNPEHDALTQGLMEHLGATSSLHLQDTAILAGQIAQLEMGVESARSTGQMPKISPLHTFIAKVSRVWIGPIRTVSMFVIALLAIIPLVLLNRAFGVNNPNWRWVGIALFLLLLPAIYEGIAFALAWLASLIGQPSLDVLSRFSFFQNDLTQILWALLMLLAIVFASIGLYGICVQFGVLGGRRGRTTVVNTTQADARLKATATDMGTDTVVDWDEDF